MNDYILSKVKGKCEFCGEPIFLNYNHTFITDTKESKTKIAHQVCWANYLNEEDRLKKGL